MGATKTDRFVKLLVVCFAILLLNSSYLVANERQRIHEHKSVQIRPLGLSLQPPAKKVVPRTGTVARAK